MCSTSQTPGAGDSIAFLQSGVAASIRWHLNKFLSMDLNILLLLWKGYLEKRCVLLPALRGNKRFVQAAKIFPYFFVKII